MSEVTAGIEQGSSALLSEIPESMVGIWRRTMELEGMVYTRDPRFANEFCHWAQVDRIPARKSGKRIVYAGESGARGFLLDPFFRPSAYLEQMLSQVEESVPVEVIDLARVSIKLKDLMKVCAECIQLEPDVLIVYAGDNWRKSLWGLTDEEKHQVLDVLNRGGEERFQGIKAVFEHKSEGLIVSFLEQLHQQYILQGIPVILVIPEFNLKDWRNSKSDRELVWPQGEQGLWLEMSSQLDRYLHSGQLEEVEKLVDRFIELNRANPKGYELLGRLQYGEGQTREARQWLERARDTSVYRLGPPPACTSFIRDQLLTYSQKYKMKVIDLPAVFNRELNGDLPGFNLFLDYCHLNPEGIHLMVSEIASAICEALGHDQLPSSILNNRITPEATIQSKAHFYAAIHSAHIGDQPYEVLYWHCCEAMKHWSGIADWFVALADLSARKTPWLLNQSYKTICTPQYVILRQFRDCMVLDMDLVRAMLQCLKEAGRDIESEINHLRIREHAPELGETVDLLETYYRENSYFNVFAGSKSVDYNHRNQIYYSARSYTSSFYLIADPKQQLLVKLTLRRQHIHQDDNQVLIKLNGAKVLEIMLDEHWSSYSFSLDGKLLLDSGVNLITFHWPSIDQVIDDMARAIQARFDPYEQIIQRARPVYGDIFKLEICNIYPLKEG